MLSLKATATRPSAFSTALQRPEDISHWFSQTSEAILKEVAAAQQAPHSAASAKELKATLTDATILAGLARYHAARQLAAVDYDLYKQSGSLPAFDDAIVHERKAIQSWREMVAAVGEQYIDNMYFGSSARNFPHHWKDELPKLDKEFTDLLAERHAASGTPGAKAVVPPYNANANPPVVTLPAASAEPAAPGSDLAVRATVTAPAGVRWIRLRYRHVNQKEDYQTLAMTQDGNTGAYTATIPGAFITPQWDLMYYVEIVDNQGTGKIYPDLEHETPYIIQGVKH